MRDAGIAGIRPGGAAERAALTLGATGLFLVGYFGVGLATDPGRARDLATPLDAWIPFLAPTVWVYLSVFPAALLPLFVVRCPDLFRRTIAAYAVTILVSLAVFAAFPVTSLGLRVDPSVLDSTRPSGFAVATLYRLDPPYNLFPSLHLSIATLAALSVARASRRVGAAALLNVAAIGVSIATVKQHFVIDGVGGVALALAVGAFTIGRYRPRPGVDPAYSWRGPAAYVLLLAAVYAGLYALFLALT